jgi:hypothetical protein
MNQSLRIISLFLLTQCIAVLCHSQGASAPVTNYPAFPGKDPASLAPLRPGEVTSVRINTESSRSQVITSCDCWAQRDRAWQVAAFTNGMAPDYRNDDGSTDTITLVSPFCFYGQYLRKLFINNNGNISFGTSYATYSSDSFPNTNFVMVAPFWADVDTRGPGSGLVWYEQTNSHLIIQWDSVGYFNAQDDKLNSFQLIITDGLDPLLPAGYNVSFCYKDMAWTTGSASQGVGGFGGIPATVGVNQGNGINYIQMGRFDQAGSAYDGPGGAYDGIDFLDNQSFIFNTCVSNFNISPVVSSLSACDTIVMCVGDSAAISVQFLAPESNQQTTPSVALGNLQDATITSLVSGAVASAEVLVYATNNNLGYHTITFSGTDNGTPARTTNTPVTIRVIGQPTAGLLMIPDTGTTVFFDNRSTNYLISYVDFGDGTAGYCYFDTLHYYAQPGTYNVMLVALSDEGCFSDTIYQTITVTGSTGINNVFVGPYVNLVPNPSKGFVRVYGAEGDKMSLRITDATGRLVLERFDISHEQSLDLRSVGSGVFIFTMLSQSGEPLKTGKLVIE